MNRVQSQSSSHQAYSITGSSDGNEFFFITDQGIKIIAYFAEADGYVPSASFAQNTRMFGFGPTRETRPEGKMPADSEIVTTLFEILYTYVSKNSNAVVLYVCSDESVWNPGPDHKNHRYAKWWSNTFAGRFENWQQTGVMKAEKIDYILYGQIYCSCVFRSGNPYTGEIRQVINQANPEKE